MFRRLGGLISLVSLALCIGVAMLWVRSRHHADLLLIRTPGHHAAGAAADHGGLLMALSDMPFEGSVDTNGQEQPAAIMSPTCEQFLKLHDELLDPQTVKISLLGFKTAAGEASLTSTTLVKFSALMLPYWFIITITGLIALRGLRVMWIHWRRVRNGLCLGCGYDVRASTGRCPECGRKIPQATAIAATIAAN